MICERKDFWPLRTFQARPNAWRDRIAGQFGFKTERGVRKMRRKIRLGLRAGRLHWGNQ